ncbi:hypothetical protein KI387_026226, partial [Taxus chinensis]
RGRNTLDGAERESVTGCQGYWMPSHQTRRTHYRGPVYCAYRASHMSHHLVTSFVTYFHIGTQIGTLSDCQGSA